MQSDPVFTTREELEAWEREEHAYLAKIEDVLFVAGSLSIMARVKRNHAHLTKDSDNAE